MHWTLNYTQHVIERLGTNASKLAQHAGLATTTLTRPLGPDGTGNPLSTRTIEKIASFSGVSPAPFIPDGQAVPLELINAIEGNAEETLPAPSVSKLRSELGRKPTKFAEIPRYPARLAAGAGTWNPDDQKPTDFIPFTWAFLESYIRKETVDGLITLTVSGDSMAPTISDNDLVMLDTNESTLDAGVFAFVLDGVARVKRFNVTMRGIDILSDNPNYETERYTREELQNMQIIGRVRWVGRAL
ncbi:MAG: S24 family peptidase [Pseudomonadota bacterium]